MNENLAIRLRQFSRLVHVIVQILTVVDVFLVDYVGSGSLPSDSKG